MKRLVCELCGGSDFIKDQGVFICLTCGLKYSLEEARRMMTETPDAGAVPSAPPVPFPAFGAAAPAAPAVPAAPAAQPVQAAPAPAAPIAPAAPAVPAAPDFSSAIDSYMVMAKKALEEEHYADAEYYAKKILELDSKSSPAWFIRGKAAGWQTTGRNNRFPESMVCWINADQFAAEEEKDALREEIVAAATGVGSAIVQMKLNKFKELRNQNNKDDVDKALAMVQDQLQFLKEKTGIDAIDDAFRTALARQLNSGAVNASNKADADFGPEDRNRDKYNWDQYTAAQDCCLDLLDQAYDLTTDEALCLQICKNYIVIAKDVRDSCSYVFQAGGASEGAYVREYTFTAAAKESRTKMINEWTERQQLHDPTHRTKSCTKALELFNAKQNKGLRQSAIAQYWQAHAEEKAALEQEKKALDEQQRRLETALDETPDDAIRQQIDCIILSLKRQIEGMGACREKEKAGLHAQIDELTAESVSYAEHWNAVKTNYDSQIKAILARKAEIDAEFTKSRGTVSRRSPKQTITLVSNGVYTATPRQIAEYIAAVAPGDVSVFGDGDGILEDYSRKLMQMAHLTAADSEDGALDGPDSIKLYHINFNADEKEMNAFASVAGPSPDAPFRGFLSFELGRKAKKPETVATFIRIVTEAVLGICPSIEISSLVTAIASAAYGMIADTVLAADGFVIEIHGNSKSAITVTLRPEK